MAQTAPALKLLLGALVALGTVGCSSDATDPTSGLDGRQCAPGPPIAALVDAGAEAEVCFETNDAGVRLFASGLGDDTTVTVTGGRGETANFEWDADAAALFISGVPQFVVLIDGQIVSSPLRAKGTWADGTPMQLSVTWQADEEN